MLLAGSAPPVLAQPVMAQPVMAQPGAATGVGSAAPTDRPLATPTRDVEVLYETPTNAPADPQQDHAAPAMFHQRLRWLQSEQRMRIDPSDGGLYMLTDYRAHRLSIVNVAAGAVLDAPAPAGSALAPGGSQGVAFVRLGAGQAAGLACQNWRMGPDTPGAVTACVTPDGVTLRVATAQRLLAQALSVTYAPQDPALFKRPTGLRQVEPPPSQ